MHLRHVLILAQSPPCRKMVSNQVSFISGSFTNWNSRVFLPRRYHGLEVTLAVVHFAQDYHAARTDSYESDSLQAVLVVFIFRSFECFAAILDSLQIGRIGARNRECPTMRDCKR